MVRVRLEEKGRRVLQKYLVRYIRYKLLLVFLPLGLLWCTNLLGPVVIYRYVYPLFISLPLFIGILLYKKKE